MRVVPEPTITFAPLSGIDPADLITLMNDPHVRRHLPLARGVFGADDCTHFLAAKAAHWAEHGYGPWAFYVEGDFAGWGGLQAQGDDFDVGLVLNRRYWGLGPRLAARFATEAFDKLGAHSVTVLVPPSRRNVAAIERAGFVPDGEVLVGDEPFQRFRLYAPSKPGF